MTYPAWRRGWAPLGVCLCIAIVVSGAAGLCEASDEGVLAPSSSGLSQAAMRLGAASNFSQGWSQRTYDVARTLPVLRLRDSIRWADVEKVPGQYRFDAPSTSYPDLLRRAGVHLTLTLNWGNPLYDGGKTPHSAEGLEAFGRFAAEAVRRFPQVDAVEIGNEVNGGNFVSGPVKAAGLAQRARYHLAMVRAAAVAVHRVRPEVEVVGGATHSLPAGFLWSLLDMPGADAIQGLAVHPYTTPIDQLRAQFGVLRRNDRVRGLPIHVTEVGSSDPTLAADDLLRSYATLASLGVAEMDWYPLNERADGMVPLIARDGAITRTGKAFRFVQQHLSGLPARDSSPDPFTSVIAFGNRIQVLWGMARSVEVNPGDVAVYDATGAPLDPHGLVLAEDRALVLIGKNSPPAVRLGCSPVVADSFFQFTYPPDQARGFQRFFHRDGQELGFDTMPGQQRPGSPWTPYLGRRDLPALRLTAESMLPAFGGKAGAIVHRYVAERDRTVRFQANFAPSRRGKDSITVTLDIDGKPLLERSGDVPAVIDQRISLRKGGSLSLAVASSGPSPGGPARYRIRLTDPDANCAPAASYRLAPPPDH